MSIRDWNDSNWKSGLDQSALNWGINPNLYQKLGTDLSVMKRISPNRICYPNHSDPEFIRIDVPELCRLNRITSKWFLTLFYQMRNKTFFGLVRKHPNFRNSGRIWLVNELVLYFLALIKCNKFFEKRGSQILHKFNSFSHVMKL